MPVDNNSDPFAIAPTGYAERKLLDHLDEVGVPGACNERSQVASAIEAHPSIVNQQRG